MRQEKEARIEHEQGPLLPVARVHAGRPGRIVRVLGQRWVRNMRFSLR